jgi:hypothetical protein
LQASQRERHDLARYGDAEKADRGDEPKHEDRRTYVHALPGAIG